MSLIALLTQKTPAVVPVDDPTRQWPSAVEAIPGDTTPTLPTSAPWNGPVAVTPTPDGTGQATHPSVVDFYEQPWNGWRFWMAMTPYAYYSEPKENPSILVSHDGFTWQVPAGLTNPIQPWNGQAGQYNSDTELVYDPERDCLICYWRPVEANNATRVLAKISTDGTTWSDVIEVIGPSPLLTVLSPCVVRRAAGDWWMFTVNRTGFNGINVYRSADPLTGWSTPRSVPLGVPDVWHMGIMWDGQAFRGLQSDWIISPATIRAISSSDGYTWAGSDSLIYPRSGEWDETKQYRPCLTVQDDDWFCVWYSSVNDSKVWHIGRTQLPRSMWPIAP